MVSARRLHFVLLLLGGILPAAVRSAPGPAASTPGLAGKSFIPYQTDSLPAADAAAVEHRIFVLGDAGRLLHGKSIVPEAIAARLDPADSNATVVFLGDNIYDKGMPDEEDEAYAESVHILQRQLNAFRGYKAGVYFIPGNHDWERGGPDGWNRIRRQAAWIDSLHSSHLHFLPSQGCPGPVEVPLGDRLVLVIVDTQWWLHPFEKPGEESDCDCKTQGEVVEALSDIAWRNRDKTIVFASHHAFRSHGIHGGYFTLKQHIFPFTDHRPGLFIPLPVIGSIYPLSRGVFGDIQDLSHPAYRHMVHSLEEALLAAPDVTFVAGHDHTLQLIREASRYYLVSGSGINMERVKTGRNTLFASSARGFSEIRVLQDGGKEIVFYEVTEDGESRQVYAESVPPVPKPAVTAEPAVQTISFPDSVTVAIAPEYDEVGRSHRFFFGQNYRRIWATPVKMRVFELEKEKGGLQIVKKGGGQQTLSLRLADSTGKEWNLRTVQKNPEKALPPLLRETVARRIVQDQISAAHPYAPLVVPPLAKALDIPHASPEMVYLPDDPALGRYREDFADAVFTFEEREPIPDDTKSTPTVIGKLDDDNDHEVDQKALLKARLLDLLIGDWDRHEDQWRWGKLDKAHGNLYFPIPRDRDQVFFTNDGVFPWIAARKWAMPKFQGFRPDIRDVNGFMFNARYFDRMFLHRLDEEDWDSVALDVQETLTDQVLSDAVHRLPDTVYSLSGPPILETLRARRSVLKQEALKYYRFLAKAVDIPGSDQREYFDIRYLPEGRLLVKVSKVLDDGTPGRLVYERIFDPAVTKEIRLYGRENEDIFSVHTAEAGTGRSPIRVRMIGGSEKDVFQVQEDIRNRSRLLIYDRSDLENAYPNPRLARLRTSTATRVNEYNPRSFMYDRLMPLATAGYNLDDGVLLGAGFRYISHGFRREPYASSHKVLLGHALATRAWFLNYEGDITQVLGNMDLALKLDVKAPHNTANFFGSGNTTVFQKEGKKPIQPYRTRYNLVEGEALLRHALGSSLTLLAGPAGYYFNMREVDNRGRFIMDYQALHPDEELFGSRLFMGLVAGFEADTRNHPLMPSRGVYWKTSLKGMQQLNGQKSRFARLETEINLFSSFSMNPRLVIANRIGAGYLFGEPGFHQLFYLGGKENLRGYRNFRFAGTGMLYHNIELRLKLFDFTSYLFPGSLGLIGFNDIGRVWESGERSGKWHEGYGAGVYLVPAEMVVLSGTVGISSEETLPYISVGFQF